MSDVSAFYDRTHFQSWHQQSENSYFWCRFDIKNLTCHFLMKEYSFQIFPGCMSFVTFLLAISAFLKTKSFHFNFQHIFHSILICERNNENIQMLESEKSRLTYSQTTWKQVDWIGYGNQIRPSTRFETSAFPSPVFFYIRMISLLFWYSIINRSSYIHIIQLLRFP